MKEEDYDRIVLAYLKRKGYKNAEAALKEESKTQPLSEAAGDRQLSLDTSIANHIYFFSRSDNGPGKYKENYGRLRSWVQSSLDLYKNELLRILYPVFVHCFLELVSKGQSAEARAFFQAYREDHERLHIRDLQKLEGVTCPSHLQETDLAKTFLENKVNVKLCQYSFQLLLTFLHGSDCMLLLGIVNEHINLQVQDLRMHPTMSTVVLEQPSAFAEEEEPITITGKPPDIMESLNQKEIQWGALEGSLEDKLEDKLASQNTSDKAETAEAGGANASKSQKKASVDSAKLPPNKKAKKDKASNVPGKAGKNEPSGSAVAVMRVKSTIPLPNLSEQAEKKALDELRKRVKLSPTALPNSCFYTFFNTYNSLNCVAFTDDGLVAGGFSDSSIKIWDMAKRSAVAGQSQEKATDVQILPSENGGGDANANDGQAGGKDSDAVVEAQRIAHGQKGRTYALLLGHTGPVYGLDFSPDSKYLLSSSADCTVRLWSVELNVNLVCYKGHNYPVWDVQYSPLGYYFASASHDRTARVWSMEKYYPLRIMAGHLSDVDCVRWHVNCNYIATGSSDKTVRLWDVQTGECMRIFTGHRGTVLSLAMSPSGRYVASGDENGTIIMWDIGSGRRLAPLLGHTDCVWTLAFSGDGSLLASGSADNTVRLWDATASTVKAGKLEDSRKSRLIKTLPTKSTPVYALRFTQRNLLLASGAFTPLRQAIQQAKASES